ncbi:MAG: diadenylate cyclase [Candidatus Bathyarchaeia archaeon]|jgi:hypothetical protein
MPALKSLYSDELAEIVTRRFLRKYDWLIKPSRKHSIELLLLQQIVDFLEEIPNLKKEGKSLSLALIIKNDQVILEPSLIKRNEFHISELSKFQDLRNIVDGNPLCYVMDKKGLVTIGQVPKELLKNSSRLTLQNISNKFNTIAFYLGSNILEIYESGKILRINRKGIWLKPIELPLQELGKIGFPGELLESVSEICLKMSYINKGCTFVIIKSNCPEYCQPMIRDYHFSKCKIGQLSLTQIINFASIDGAVILNINGEILDIGQRLIPPPTTSYVKESGRGTRHNSAAMYSNAVESVVVVVSEDGPISIYYKGDIYSRCFGEIFG